MKGENNMIIAIPYQNGEVFQHFGHTEQFKLYQVEEGNITQKMLIPTGGSGHSALAGLLSRLKVEALICGGIGGGAQAALAEAGIRVYGGVQGDADAAAQALLPAMVSATGARADGIFRRDTYTGLNWSTVPCILVEMGYMSNPEEDRLLATEEYRLKMAKGIADGIDKYFEN
jgi:N-acetylmuramoyl-L-alanine amidase